MKKEHKINEEFSYNGFTLTVKEGGGCEKCHLLSDPWGCE